MSLANLITLARLPLLLLLVALLFTPYLGGAAGRTGTAHRPLSPGLV